VHGWPFGNVYRYAPGIGPARLPFSIKLGFCGGMVFCALDRFYAREPMPTNADRPVQGQPLFDALFRRQRQTMRGVMTAKTYAWQVTADEDDGSKPGLGTLTTREWDRVRKSINAGHPVPICLIREKGILGKVWNNHQVVVRGYGIDPDSGRVTLSVYDPNHRNRNGVTIQFTPGSRIDGRQYKPDRTLDAPMRGFFVIDYDRPVPPHPPA
jgi:hypothetical protein